MYAGFDPRDPRCDPVYTTARSTAFRSSSTWYDYNRAAPLGFTRPWLFDDVAIKYPELRMVLAHVGHPFCEECLVVIRKHPHVYADISALYYRPWQFYNMLIAARNTWSRTNCCLARTILCQRAGVDRRIAPSQSHRREQWPTQVSQQAVEEILGRDAFACWA